MKNIKATGIRKKHRWPVLSIQLITVDKRSGRGSRMSGEGEQHSNNQPVPGRQPARQSESELRVAGAHVAYL
ncbi:MAG TPA: hypothetical protein VJN91_06400 [Gammaproteobacteria bacterium]|nr:hypothetical protein [Gammaproteobacteria bacterium]